MERVAVETMGLEGLLSREWLVTDGVGGYASSTICGMNTRKYHGLLVAAMSPPVQRMVILSRVDETVITSAGPVDLATNEYPEILSPQGYHCLRAFSPEPFPRWAFQSDGFTLEKSLRLLPGENTVCLTYTLLAGDKPVELQLRPLLALRSIHELMYQFSGRPRGECDETCGRVHISATSRTPEVFLAHDGEFIDAPVWYLNTIYRREQERGYAGLEDLWMPGVIGCTLTPGKTIHLACSTEKIDLRRVIELVSRPPEDAGVSIRAPLRSADKELGDLAQASSPYVLNYTPSSGGQAATAIMTHYPWSSPSVRGEMISLPGLLLVPGRFDEARSLLESRAALADAGVLPSLLPEDSSKAIYQGADVSLWFIHAAHQYLHYSGDEATARRLLDVIDSIIHHYCHGTHLGIGADADGLISTRMDGTPTTWMDAKLVDCVITPRQGQAVEINALWHNALRVGAELHRKLGRPDRVRELTDMAESVQQAFNRHFWNDDLNCLFDVVDGAWRDASVRPNQIFAVSLPYATLWSQRHATVIDMVVNELLTPLGLRTLSPRDPAYHGRYGGDVVRRDRAYHQGSAFPWLLGPLVTAIVKTRGRTPAALSLAREILRPALDYISGDGLGQIRELFDGELPQRPGGALASAPAAGELMRAWAEDVLAISPQRAAAEERPAAVAIARQ